MKINNKLKKVCGEQLAQFLTRNFEQESCINLITTLFNNQGRDIRQIDQKEFNNLKILLNKKLNEQKDEKEVKQPHPEKLLESVGYTLHKTETYADMIAFKKYFRAGEELCKFNDKGRPKNYHMYWIVKENASDIEPAEKPTRQDEYSTSVCSIQISKSGQNVTQITSRYNHKVSGCDNTFNSNLNSIVDGLTESFNQHFKYQLKQSNSIEFENFVFIDSKYVYYTREINGVKFGINTIVSDKIINYESGQYYFYDYFIINLKTKQIEWDDTLMGYHDSFVDLFNSNVEKIEFVKNINDVNDGNSDKICYIQR